MFGTIKDYFMNARARNAIQMIADDQMSFIELAGLHCLVSTKRRFKRVYFTSALNPTERHLFHTIKYIGIYRQLFIPILSRPILFHQLCIHPLSSASSFFHFAFICKLFFFCVVLFRVTRFLSLLLSSSSTTT